eukprot:g34.t1
MDSVENCFRFKCCKPSFAELDQFSTLSDMNNSKKWKTPLKTLSSTKKRTSQSATSSSKWNQFKTSIQSATAFSSPMGTPSKEEMKKLKKHRSTLLKKNLYAPEHAKNSFQDRVRFGFSQTLCKFGGGLLVSFCLDKTPVLFKGNRHMYSFFFALMLVQFCPGNVVFRRLQSNTLLRLLLCIVVGLYKFRKVLFIMEIIQEFPKEPTNFHFQLKNITVEPNFFTFEEFRLFAWSSFVCFFAVEGNSWLRKIEPYFSGGHTKAMVQLQALLPLHVQIVQFIKVLQKLWHLIWPTMVAVGTLQGLSKASNYFESDFIWSESLGADFEARLVQFLNHRGEETGTFSEVDDDDTFQKQRWDNFYCKGGHYKPRRYMLSAFPEIEEHLIGKEMILLLEIGCGSGSAIFPVIQCLAERENKEKMTIDAVAVDFSQRAVSLVQEEAVKLNLPAHVHFSAFCCDVTADQLPRDELDLTLLVFALSAVAPDKQCTVLEKIYKATKPGGVVLFRDYGLYDSKMLRWPLAQRISSRFFSRDRSQNGTFAYFFSKECVSKRFKEAGFEVVSEPRYSVYRRPIV